MSQVIATFGFGEQVEDAGAVYPVRIDPFVQEAFSSASLVRGRNWQQTSNNVEYHSPVFWGFDVQAQYAFGNQAGAFNSGASGEFGRSDGIMLTYHSPLFDVRGIYDELRDSNGRFTNIFQASREYFAGANVHFEDNFENGAMTFDYRMREGVVQKSNALALMRAVGLDV